MEGNPKYDIRRIRYTCYPLSNRRNNRGSIRPIGIDTEAYKDGRMFMFATSEGDVFQAEDFPGVLFSRKYRGETFVAYNLKYEQGAFLQHLPMSALRALQKGHRITFQAFTYKVIGKKCLVIRRGRNAITFYDMYNFYHGSLEYNASKYLGRHKKDIETKTFTPEYVRDHWQEIASYCVNDAVLVRDLAALLISKFETFGIYPRKLYSTAYISYQYFRCNTNYVTVKRFWDDEKDVLDYALKSYNGGKFEVTQKGIGYYYEYDIVSAYPYEIANLLDVTNARVVRDRRYRKGAVYGFLHCAINITTPLHSPVSLQYQNICVYPVGSFQRVITKNEYDYLIKHGADVEIIDGIWLYVNHRVYPYRKEIQKLVKKKQEFKKSGDELDYHTIKIFLNSLYGKFCQLIPVDKHYKASTCWNPIYASIITANTRIRISEMQQNYPQVVAVHTDSIITTKPIEVANRGRLGDLVYECEGEGVIVGSGIYQIGKKSKLRGFDMSTPLMEMIDKPKRTISIPDKRVYTWREVAFHNWDRGLINRFETIPKRISCDFDMKRHWLDDVTVFRELLNRRVDSLPRFADMFA